MVLHSATRNHYNLWPKKTIPYAISSRYTKTARSMIAKAIKDFQSRNCLKFVARKRQKDYIYIQPESGCFSSVGRTGGGQIVSVDDGCFQHGTIIHELMHRYSNQWRSQGGTLSERMIQSSPPLATPLTISGFQGTNWVVQPVGSAILRSIIRASFPLASDCQAALPHL